jgi:protease IV
MSTPPPLLPEEQIRRAENDIRRQKRLKTWLFLFLILSICLNVAFFGIWGLRTRAVRIKEPNSVFVERYLSGEKDSSNKITVIRLEGLIAREIEGHVGHDGMVGDLKEQFRIAQEDDDTKAIILRVDSPGGEVLASDEIFRAVRDVRDGNEDYSKKPVICSMGSVAASGGFYAAMGSNWIVADKLTITGSIGVIMQTLNYKDLFGKIGLKSLVFKSGKFKDLLNGAREPTQEELDLVQQLVLETYDQFLNVVATERKLDATMLRDTIADGRILSGKQALDAKLIDQLGNFDDAVTKAKKMAGISEAKVSDFMAPFSFRDLFNLFAESRIQKIEIEPMPQSMKLQQGKLYYLSLHMF